MKSIRQDADLIARLLFGVGEKESTAPESVGEELTFEVLASMQEKLDVAAKVGNGLRIVETAHMVEQYRFPRTKKRRIRNKWAARPGNFRPARHAVVLDDMLLVHPSMAAQLRERLEREILAGMGAPKSAFGL